MKCSLRLRMRTEIHHVTDYSVYTVYTIYTPCNVGYGCMIKKGVVQQ